MKKTEVGIPTVIELEKKKSELLDRIMVIEADIKRPLDPEAEQALQVANRLILVKLLDVERANYIQTCEEISKRILFPNK